MSKKKSPDRSAVKVPTTTGERDYADDEAEFIREVAAYRESRHRPFPTLCEILAVLKALGYRKGAVMNHHPEDVR